MNQEQFQSGQVSVPPNTSSILELMSKAWDFYLDRFKDIFLIVFVVYLPINLLMHLVPEAESMQGLRTQMKLQQLLEGFVGVIATLAIIFLIIKQLEGARITVKEAFHLALSKWGSVIVVQLLLGIFLLGLYLLLVIPGIIFTVYWIFEVYAVALKGLKGKAALDYSKAIVAGRWWKTLGYSICFGAPALLLVAVYFFIIYFTPDSLVNNVGFSVAFDICFDVGFAFLVVLYTFFFLDFSKDIPVPQKT